MHEFSIVLALWAHYGHYTRSWDRSPSLFIARRPGPFIDTNFSNFQKKHLAQHARSNHESFHSLVKYFAISPSLLVYPRGFLAAKQTGFLKFLQIVLKSRRRLRHGAARFAGVGLPGCRGSTLAMLITVVSQTGAIIHHKATQRRLRVNCRESRDQLLLLMVRQISFDTITPPYRIDR